MYPAIGVSGYRRIEALVRHGGPIARFPPALMNNLAQIPYLAMAIGRRAQCLG